MYTLTATYGGDSTHAASLGTTQVVVTTTPTDGGPQASDPGGVDLPPDPSTPAPTLATPGTIRITGGTIKVSAGRVARIRLTCIGDSGATCQGTLGLTALFTSRVKLKTKVKVQITVKLGHRTRTKTVTRMRTKRKTVSTLVTLGSVNYALSRGIDTRGLDPLVRALPSSRIIAARHQRSERERSGCGRRSRGRTDAGPQNQVKKKTRPVKKHTAHRSRAPGS